MSPKPTPRVRLKDKRRRVSYLSYSVATVAVLALIGGVAYVTRLPELNVTSIRIDGVTRGDTAAITANAQEVLDGTYVFLVPKSLKYVVPRGELNASVVQAFPLIKAVRTELTHDRELVVTVEERIAAALWCSDSVCFRMDEYGYVFDRAVGDEQQRKYFGELAEPLGATFLDGNFHDLATLIDQLEEALQGPVTTVTMGADGDITAALLNGGALRFTKNSDESELVRDATALFRSAPFTEGRTLEYVDLRFPGKAVAKFKE